MLAKATHWFGAFAMINLFKIVKLFRKCSRAAGNVHWTGGVRPSSGSYEREIKLFCRSGLSKSDLAVTLHRSRLVHHNYT